MLRPIINNGMAKELFLFKKNVTQKTIDKIKIDKIPANAIHPPNFVSPNIPSAKHHKIKLLCNEYR